MDGSLKLDTLGFLSQSCPGCTRRFKVRAAEGTLKQLAHCPFCDHDGDNFYTPDQRRYLEVFAARAVQESLDNQLKGLAGWKRVPLPALPNAPDESDGDLPASTNFTCCTITVRHDGTTPARRCVACGVAVSG